VSTEERLQLLEDERAILRVLHAYGHAIDYDLEDTFADCWTDDAVATYNFDIPNAKAPTGIQNFALEGKGEIMDFFRRHTHAPAAYHKHFLVEPRIEVDGDRATVSSYYARLDETTDRGPMMSSFGCYRDVFARGADGRWRLQERHATTESRGPRQ
jgi:ketosteroid isomerase-like protein